MHSTIRHGLTVGATAGFLTAARDVAVLGNPQWFDRVFFHVREASLYTVFMIAGGALVGVLIAAVIAFAHGALQGPEEAPPHQPVPRPLRVLIAVIVGAALALDFSIGNDAVSRWAELALLAGILLSIWPGFLARRDVSSVGIGAAVIGGAVALVTVVIGRSVLDPGVASVSGILKGIAVVGLAVGAGLGTRWLLDRFLSALGGRVGTRAVGVAALGAPLIALAVLGAWQLRDYAGRTDRAVAAVPSGSQAEGNAAPSVILISIDALRNDVVGYMGGDARTPNLDAVAQEAYVFETAQAPAPWTRPSFAAFFASLYPFEMGVARIADADPSRGKPFPYTWNREPETLTEVLNDSGYTTAATVTNANLTSGAGADQGFDVFYHCAAGAMGPGLRQVNRLLGDPLPGRNELERADVVTGTALRMLDRQPPRPLALWVHYMDPHHPYDAPDAPPSERVNFSPSESLAVLGGMARRSPHTRQPVRLAYLREVEYCDQWLGTLVDELKSRGWWDSSIVVIWSDHGEEFWDHGRWEHGHSYHRELIEVPMLIHLPEQTEGRRITSVVSLLDVMPTVLDVCDLPAPDGLRGRSLMPLMEDADPQYQPREIMLEGKHRGGLSKAMIVDGHKLIFDLHSDRFELYDLEADPWEHRDLFGLPSAPDTAQWEARLRDWSAASTAAMLQQTRTSTESISPETLKALKDMGYVQ